MTAAIDGVMIYWLAVSGPIPHPSDSGNERKPFVSDSHLVMRSVNLAEAKAGLSALLAAVETGEGVVISPACAASKLTSRGRRGPQWSCCGSCAIRSPESHGGNLPPVLQPSPPRTGLPGT